ncbi:MAG: hypothetical protein RIS47_1744, partial [Bacteroidota bacterium]
MLFWFVRNLCDFNWNLIFFTFSLTNNHLLEWLLLVFLMIPNWLIEAYKWKFLSNPHHKITLAQSLLQIWKATALGFFTPGRYGEIAARAVLQTQSRVQASYSAGLNSATQSLVTLLFGLLGFSLIGVAALSNTLSVNVWFSALVILLASGAVVFFIWLTYKNLHSISLTLFVKLLYWCTLRYLVFLGQFVLVLRISGESINPTTFYAIWSYYLLNMMLPVLALIEISVKA